MNKLPFKYKLIKGAIGKQVVVKLYSYGVVSTKFPAMGAVVASNKQLAAEECI